MIKDEFKRLLDKDWTIEQKTLITNIMQSVIYYRKLLPRSLETNIIDALKLCNTLKDELEELRREKLTTLQNEINVSLETLDILEGPSELDINPEELDK